jgi:hypothetical protein
MPAYSFFVSYRRNTLSVEWTKMQPFKLDAAGEIEISQTATTLSDVFYPEFASELLIRVVGEQEPGKTIAEFRRPKETP